MRLPIWQSVSASESSTFESVLTLQGAAQSLAAVVESSEFANWGVDCLVGRVTTEEVHIARHRAGQRTPTRPVFRGRFSEAGGKILLQGRFTYPLSTRLLLMALVAFLLVFAVALLVFGLAVLLVRHPAAPSRGVGVASAILALVLVGV